MAGHDTGLITPLCVAIKMGVPIATLAQWAARQTSAFYFSLQPQSRETVGPCKDQLPPGSSEQSPVSGACGILGHSAGTGCQLAAGQAWLCGMDTWPLGSGLRIAKLIAQRPQPLTQQKVAGSGRSARGQDCFSPSVMPSQVPAWLCLLLAGIQSLGNPASSPWHCLFPPQSERCWRAGSRALGCRSVPPSPWQQQRRDCLGGRISSRAAGSSRPARLPDSCCRKLGAERCAGSHPFPGASS